MANWIVPVLPYSTRVKCGQFGPTPFISIEKPSHTDRAFFVLAVPLVARIDVLLGNMSILTGKEP